MRHKGHGLCVWYSLEAESCAAPRAARYRYYTMVPSAAATPFFGPENVSFFLSKANRERAAFSPRSPA